MSGDFSNAKLIKDLNNWYQENYRPMPWRQPPGLGQHEQPYHVFLSEFMLQQTVVQTVIPYFHRFIKTWPCLKDLAMASQDDIIREWSGLGYYARARNMHKAANRIVKDFAGNIPDDADILKTLNGIGPYTAGAISAIAFDRPAIVLDGNIERIMVRLFNITTPIPHAKDRLRKKAFSLTPKQGAGDHVQALMDLGAMICKPKMPDCKACPLQIYCKATKKGMDWVQSLPRKLPKKTRPTRYGRAIMLTYDDHIFLMRRPDHGLLSGTMALPTDDWTQTEDKTWDWQAFKHYKKAVINEKANSPIYVGQINHIFTHFHLILHLYSLKLTQKDNQFPQGEWVHVKDINKAGLSSLMRKAIQKSNL